MQNFINFFQAELYFFHVDFERAADRKAHKYVGIMSLFVLTGSRLAGARRRKISSDRTPPYFLGPIRNEIFRISF